mmetsp:Transcript_8058/g.32197  ORF Transcript_8058/g.32197 Transcript_8058/m.32197 type:complete len:201 (+) Transcript_8058:139-741(+)
MTRAKNGPTCVGTCAKSNLFHKSYESPPMRVATSGKPYPNVPCGRFCERTSRTKQHGDNTKISPYFDHNSMLLRDKSPHRCTPHTTTRAPLARARAIISSNASSYTSSAKWTTCLSLSKCVNFILRSLSTMITSQFFPNVSAHTLDVKPLPLHKSNTTIDFSPRALPSIATSSSRMNAHVTMASAISFRSARPLRRAQLA